MFRAVLVLFLVAACGSKENPPAPTAPAAPAPAPAPVAKPVPASAPVLKARPGGPSVESCERAADHLAAMLVQATAPSGITEAEQAYVTTMLAASRSDVILYCLQIAVVKEIECVLAAKDVGGVAGCEARRRELPADMMERTDVTLADCEKFFDRLRQFKLAEGATPAEVDQTRDQIVRACQEKAKPGTIACFLASPDYAHARRCP